MGAILPRKEIAVYDGAVWVRALVGFLRGKDRRPRPRAGDELGRDEGT